MYSISLKCVLLGGKLQVIQFPLWTARDPLGGGVLGFANFFEKPLMNSRVHSADGKYFCHAASVIEGINNKKEMAS